MLISCPNCGQQVEESNLIGLEDQQVCPLCRDEYIQRLKEGAQLKSGNDAADTLNSLHYGSTWKLFLLTVITLGIYLGHYILRQNKIINEQLSDADKIRNGLALTILVGGYLSIILFIPVLINPEWYQLESVSDAIDSFVSILCVVWGFKMRNRMNVILEANQGEATWFHGGGTFFFTPFYFNYKVNKLLES